MSSEITYESPLEDLLTLSLQELRALDYDAVIKIKMEDNHEEWMLPTCDEDKTGLFWTHASVGVVPGGKEYSGFMLLYEDVMKEKPAAWFEEDTCVSITFHHNMEVIPILKSD